MQFINEAMYNEARHIYAYILIQPESLCTDHGVAHRLQLLSTTALRPNTALFVASCSRDPYPSAKELEPDTQDDKDAVAVACDAELLDPRVAADRGATHDQGVAAETAPHVAEHRVRVKARPMFGPG
jgi:hypothetical protein